MSFQHEQGAVGYAAEDRFCSISDVLVIGRLGHYLPQYSTSLRGKYGGCYRSLSHQILPAGRCSMELKKLIAASFGSEAAGAWANFSPSGEQLEVLRNAALELLSKYPKMTGECILMSAVFAARVEKIGLPRAYLVAGRASARHVV
jgi:hypothetical protein